MITHATHKPRKMWTTAQQLSGDTDGTFKAWHRKIKGTTVPVVILEMTNEAKAKRWKAALDALRNNAGNGTVIGDADAVLRAVFGCPTDQHIPAIATITDRQEAMTFTLTNPVGEKTELTEAEAKELVYKVKFLDDRSSEQVWEGLVSGMRPYTAGFGRPGYGGLWGMTSE